MRRRKSIYILFTAISALFCQTHGFLQPYRSTLAPTTVQLPIQFVSKNIGIFQTTVQPPSYPTRRESRVALHSSGILALSGSRTAIQASLAMLFAAVTGIKADRKIPGSGILVTLCMGAALSRVAGGSSVLLSLNDMIWTNILPASLVFLLLSLPPNDNPQSSNTAKVVMRLAAPFTIASLGSIVGCICSFGLTLKYPSVIAMSPRDALLAASCLSASFVGGSVNFLATAAALNAHQASLVGSMAAVDILVMAFYFCGLGSCVKSEGLKKWFEASSTSSPADDVSASARSNDRQLEKTETTEESPHQSRSFVGLRTVTLSVLAATVIVHFANRVERLFSSLLPGTACLVIAVATPIVQRGFRTFTRAHDLSRWTSPLFEVCFFLLFASMGISTDVVKVINQGRACLLFASLALLVHGLMTIFGCKWYRRLDPSIQLFDTLIASNAAIGGATTAAAFGGQAPPEQRKELVVAGTLWGIAGYAIGTTVGLTIYRMLKQFTV